MEQLEVGLVEGWNGPVSFRLRDDDGPKNLTGYTVVGDLYDRNGNSVSVTGDVTVVTATDGIVKLTPDAADFLIVRSPYSLRFKATIGGEDVWFPSEAPICITVRR